LRAESWRTYSCADAFVFRPDVCDLGGATDELDKRIKKTGARKLLSAFIPKASEKERCRGFGARVASRNSWRGKELKTLIVRRPPRHHQSHVLA